MDKKKCLGILLAIATLVIMGACDKKDTPPQLNNLEVRYIEQICCGNLMITGNLEIQSPCESYQDSLLRAINLEGFNIPQRFQFGDTFSIGYQLTEDCEASCEITCNRYNGIPIKIISID